MADTPMPEQFPRENITPEQHAMRNNPYYKAAMHVAITYEGTHIHLSEPVVKDAKAYNSLPEEDRRLIHQSSLDLIENLKRQGLKLDADVTVENLDKRAGLQWATLDALSHHKPMPEQVPPIPAVPDARASAAKGR